MSYYNHLIGSQSNAGDGWFMFTEADQGITLAAGNKVPLAADLSGNGRNWAQATSASQATLGTGPNGLPALIFNGAQTYDIPFAALSVPYWIIFVSQSTVNTNNLIFDGLTSTTRNFFYGSTGGFWAGAPTDVLVKTPVDTALHLHAIKINGATSQYSVNGGSWSTVNLGAHTLAGIRIGRNYLGTNQFVGVIQAHGIMTNAALVAEKIDYLKTKYI